MAEATTTERPTTTAGEAATPPSIPGPVNDEGTSVVSGDSMELELDDFYFAPTFVQADAGSEVTVRLHNEGSAAHTYTIDALGVDQVVQPGEETEIAVSLPADGPVVFYCRFHEAQGMQGAFFFE